MHVQLGLGPAPQHVLGQPRFPLAAPSSRNDNAIDGPRLADRVPGVDRPAGRVGHVGGSIEEPREPVVCLRDGVAHARTPRDFDRLVVDENPHQ